MGDIRGACPLDCPDTCGWVVTVKDGAAVSLRGARDHPYTRGALCSKVDGYLAYRRSPDRLLYPMRRTGRKGAGAFTRISWDEALETIAQRFSEAIAADGPESIWPIAGSGNMGLLQGIYGAGRRLWNVLGASRTAYTLCTVAGGAGTGYTLGDNRVGMDPETFRYAKLVILWGANVLSTHPHLWRPILDARREGAFVVAIDPIRTRTAEASDRHLAPRPGSDAALALGLLHVVLCQEREDREFIAARTIGWDAFRARILEWPPERVAEATDLPVDAIVDLGTRLADSRPTAIRIGIGLQRHRGGGSAVRAITCIPGVTGDWRYPGGGVFYDTRGFFGLDWEALWRDDLRTRPARTLDVKRLGATLLERRDPPVKALFIHACNPAASVPNQAAALAGLARDDLFTVVAEHFLTDTARYADILLPATMATEHRDLLIAYGHLYIAWNEPATEPPGECLSTADMFRRLARALALDAPALYESDETMAAQILASGHPSLTGITLDALEAHGWMRLNYPNPFVPFAERCPTSSGRIELVSERMASAGLDPVAGWVPSFEPPDAAAADEYPLTLISPANHSFMNSMFANVPRQLRRAGAIVILIHPRDARRVGLRDGDRARVANPTGAFAATVTVTDAVRPGVIASTKGRWLSLSAGGANVNATVGDRDADMGGGARYHDNRVRIDKAVDVFRLKPEATQG